VELAIVRGAGKLMLTKLLIRSVAAGLFLLGTALHATSYYVDSQKGNDANPGTSTSKPWQTLTKVNTSSFKPGDRVCFRAGGVWEGQLVPPSSGSAGHAIIIDRYGNGPLPKLNGDGMVDDVIYLHNVNEIEVHHLEITNKADTEALRRGVDIYLDNFGTARHIVLADLFVHDIRGTNTRKDNGGIIFRTMGNRIPSRFDDLLIERNIVWRVDRSAIAAESYHARRTRWFPSLHVVIRDNYVEDIGGDGIVPWATDRAIIEHNIARYCNRRAGSFNAGIWPWSADNSIFQLNEAAFTQTTKDGEGFDSDYNSRNTLFQYNFSHDNTGGFMLICTPVKRDPVNNVGNTGTIIRENVSRNDHNRIFNLSGADDVRVEKNAVYVSPGDDVQMLLISSWEGWSKNALFEANKFYIQGHAAYGHEVHRDEDGKYEMGEGWGPAQQIRFVGNDYFGSNATAPEDSQGHIDRSVTASAWQDDEPAFDPSSPDHFAQYLRSHRKWLIAMLERSLGTKIHLEE
jgi:hypothetical protein